MTQRTLIPSARLSGEVLPHDDLSSMRARSRVQSPLSAPLRVRWRIHDRTHLELPIEYSVEAGDGETTFEWDAYFFAPASFRIDRLGYDREALQADFRSYVRFSAPRLSLQQLALAPLTALASQLRGEDEVEATRALRVFACCVRRAAISEQRHLSQMIDGRAARLLAMVKRLTSECDGLALALRGMVEAACVPPGALATALAWVEEDVAQVLEMLLSGLARRARRISEAEEARALLVDAAVKLARHRRDHGLTTSPSADLNQREVEHMEFRRHTLKRFSSSVLWLTSTPQEPGRFIKQFVYAAAAGLAMTFAVAAALINGPSAARDQLPMWLVVAVLAYAVKDRLKATLQDFFMKFVRRKVPDRRWLIHDDDSGVDVARMDEQTRFVDFEDVPAPVLNARRLTRQHPIEEVARPETVLWHKKAISIDPVKLAQASAPTEALLEIFRLDLARWLTHTDDPKQRLVFADPEAGEIASVVAPRVYNIAIVFRVRKAGDEDEHWHRVRVVVSRKGLRRIEPIC